MHHHDFDVGDDFHTDLRTGAVNDLVVLKAPWATEAVAAKRRIYVDLGANLYESSIGNWFRASYPDAGTYKVYAFEAEHKYDASYAGHPDVTLLHYAVSTANGTIPWGHMVKKGGRTRSGFALGPAGGGGSNQATWRRGPKAVRLRAWRGGRRLGSSHNLVQDGTRPAIDIADWLRRTVRPDDFVVVKMDIEGAEYDVVPHLIAREGRGPDRRTVPGDSHRDEHVLQAAARRRPPPARRDAAAPRARDAGVYEPLDGKRVGSIDVAKTTGLAREPVRRRKHHTQANACGTGRTARPRARPRRGRSGGRRRQRGVHALPGAPTAMRGRKKQQRPRKKPPLPYRSW